MPYLKVDDDEYWEAPQMFAAMHQDRERRASSADELDPRIREFVRAFRSTQFVLGEPQDPSTPAANVIFMPPGYGLPYHAHECDVFMFVLQGSLHVPGKVLGPGDGMTAKANEFYGPEVAGPEGCLRVEFFSQIRGLTDTLYERRDGEVFNLSAYETGVTPPYRELAGMEGFRALRDAARGGTPAGEG